MHAIVLGAGVTGVTTAWYLRQSGFEVTVIDRQPAAGLETSYANGGQISVSHAEPWANPGAPLKVLKWLMKEDAPLLFRLRADPAQWRWGLQFLRECTPGRTAHNIRNIVNLGLYSREQLQRLRAATGIAYDQRQQGILHFYTSEQEYAAAQEPARIMREQGCELDMKTPEECAAIEPALAQCRAQIVGGSMTPSDESGDAHRFTQALAALAAQAGVKFRYQTRVLGFEREGQDLARVIVADANGGNRAPGRRPLCAVPGLLQPRPGARAGRVAQHLPGQGLLDDAAGDLARTQLPGLADRRRVQAGVLAPGRSPARGRHGRAQWL